MGLLPSSQTASPTITSLMDEAISSLPKNISPEAWQDQWRFCWTPSQGPRRTALEAALSCHQEAGEERGLASIHLLGP